MSLDQLDHDRWVHRCCQNHLWNQQFDWSLFSICCKRISWWHQQRCQTFEAFLVTFVTTIFCAPTSIVDIIDIKIKIKRSWVLCVSCQVGPRCQHLDDSVIATAIVDLPSSLSSPPPSPWTQHRSSSLYEICICAKIIQ